MENRYFFTILKLKAIHVFFSAYILVFHVKWLKGKVSSCLFTTH